MNFLLYLLCFPGALAMARTEYSLNKNWRFHLESQDGAQRQDVDLPHTWNRDDGQSPNYVRGAGWYEKVFYLPEDYKATDHAFIRFEAANQSADVYINGTLAGHHDGGYTAFTFDITPYLAHPHQPNRLRVRVTNEPTLDIAPIRADYTFFGGLYRGVHLILTPASHVDLTHYSASGVEVQPVSLNEQTAKLQFAIWLRCDSTRAVEIEAKIAGTVQRKRVENCGAAGEDPVLLPFTLDHPHLWQGRRDPYLYTTRVRLFDPAAKTMDQVVQTFGLRNLAIDPSSGFYLNGQSYPLYGASFHQDWAGKGWAISRADERADVAIVKELGATSVRLAHYPHSDHIMDLLDRAGLIAWAEVPLVSQLGTSGKFAHTSEQQLLEMIHQQYNHPSIAVWGLFNEVHADPTGLLPRLKALAHREDPSRPTAAASDLANDDPLNRIPDVIAFNRYFGWYRGEFSDFGNSLNEAHGMLSQPIAVSEYGAGASPWQHQDPPAKPTPVSPFHPEEWQALFHEKHWEQLKTRPFVWASYIWNLFDFASGTRHEGGELGINDKGLVSYDRRVRKDAFYFYKAQWNPEPFAHITSARFAPRPSGKVTVKAYGNVAFLDLYINGTLKGRAYPEEGVIFRWPDVDLAPGPKDVRVISDRGIEDHVRW